MRLDEVTIFNGKLSFLIPHHWGEQDDGDDGTFLFCEPNGVSGWLRASLITVTNVTNPRERLQSMFANSQTARVDPETGNWVERWEKDSVEDGDDIHLYYWKVANFVSPNLIREAVFTYTVLRTQRNSDSEELVGLLDELLGEARFA